MKAAAFDLVVPVNMAGATSALRDPDARPLAGGQSLGPMLNFRVIRPATLIDIAHLTDLAGVEESAEAVTIGAATTHAAIEDGRVPDIGWSILARVAGGIAYRAVRNRGTIGGSLCHADPAADWVTVLMALGASVLLTSANATRTLPIADFFRGPYQTALQTGEILQAVRIPRLAAGATWSYAKRCRKPGEFAHAMAAVLRHRNGRARVVVGALGGAPLMQDDVEAVNKVADQIPGEPAARHIAISNLFYAWHESEKI